MPRNSMATSKDQVEINGLHAETLRLMVESNRIIAEKLNADLKKPYRDSIWHTFTVAGSIMLTIAATVLILIKAFAFFQ